MAKNELECNTIVDRTDRRNPLKTACYFKGKRYLRKIDHIHSKHRNIKEIIEYLTKRGYKISNVIYPDINRH